MDLSRTIPSDAYLDTFTASLAHAGDRGGRGADDTDDVRWLVHGRRRGGRFRELGELDHASRIGEGLGEPVGLERERDGPEHGFVLVHQRSRPFARCAHASRPRGRARWGVSARRSSPASASPSSCVLVAFFLVLPKMGQVKDANAALAEAQSQQATLGAQLAALQAAQTDAPANRETIRKVQQAIPPTVDQQGFMLLMQNAAVESGVDVVTITPSNPDLRPGHGPFHRDATRSRPQVPTSRSPSSCSRSRPCHARRRRPLWRSRPRHPRSIRAC